MRIALLGDIALLGRYDRVKTDDVDSRLQEIRAVTETCDFIIANLETPLTDKMTTSVCKGAYLRSAPCNVETLVHLGVTHVTLANNHIFDYGAKGKKDTVSILEQNNISCVGLNQSPALLVCRDDRALLDGFCCYSANGIKYGSKLGRVKLLCEESLLRFFEQAQQKKALPIISAHFGVEGVHYPALEHRKFFDALSGRLEYVLHGNHPHAVQGIEKDQYSLRIYSQGNLCFDSINTLSIRHAVDLNDSAKEHENIVVVIEVENNALCDYQVYGFSDGIDGFQHRCRATEVAIRTYSDVLKLPFAEYVKYRHKDMQNLHDTAQKRNLKFYWNRFNRKYIGAYINGIVHARKYRNVFKKYL